MGGMAGWDLGRREEVDVELTSRPKPAADPVAGGPLNRLAHTRSEDGGSPPAMNVQIERREVKIKRNRALLIMTSATSQRCMELSLKTMAPLAAGALHAARCCRRTSGRCFYLSCFVTCA